MTTGRVAAIGERTAVQGFGLAGALVHVAETPDDVLAAWGALPPDVAVVLLSRAAACVVPDRSPGTLPLTVVIPG